MNLVDKYLGEKSFPSGRTAYTPGDIVKIKKGNKKYVGQEGEVVQNLLDKPDQKIYHIEVNVSGKKLVFKNTEVELVKPRIL